MKIIDYQTLLADHKPQGHISAEANSIANALIRDNCIQAGNDLARFLEVDTCSLERELRDLFTNPGYGY